MVSCWLNQVQLFSSHFLCDIFPLFAGIFHRCTASYTKEKTIVRISNIAFPFSFKSSVEYKIFDFFSFYYFYSLVQVQKRVSQGLKVLQYYTTRNWVFKNDNLMKLHSRMNQSDRERFNFNVDEVTKQKNKNLFLVFTHFYVKILFSYNLNLIFR